MGVSPPPSPVFESADRQPGDFGAGSADDGARLSVTKGGPEVILAPTVAIEFAGSDLPADWFVDAWKEGGGAELDSGLLRLEGARAGYSGLFGSNRSLEFVATFSRRPHQHVGFGTNFRDVPWVSFSTKFGHSVYARSHFFIPEDTRLPPTLLGTPHRYRINWNVIDLEYWVDGQRLAYQLVPIVGYMRPLASNASLGGDPLTVEWMRMSPYRPAGSFTSRVHDAGGPAAWLAWEEDAERPPRTTLSIELRTGDAPTPDGSWSGWRDPGALETMLGRFAQYRALLATADPASTPVLRGVTLRYSTTDGEAPGSSASGSSGGGGAIGM